MNGKVNIYRGSLEEDIKLFIRYWNNTYPIDRWWRKKYNVAFNSPAHKQQCILDMRIDWEEDRMFNDSQAKEVDGLKKQEYVPGKGIIFVPQPTVKVSEKESIEDFDSINIDNIEIEKDGTITI